MKLPRYPKYKDSGLEWLGAVPEHWDLMRLRYVARLNPLPDWLALEKQQAEYPFLPMEAIGETGSLDVSRKKPLSESRSGYSYFANGDVVYAKVTPCFENGKGAVIHDLEYGHGFGTTELTTLRPHSVNADYLYALTCSTAFRQLGAAEMQGAGGLKRVPEDFARNFKFGLPPEEEQSSVVAFLNTETKKADALAARQQRLIDLLNEKRQAVIARAVTVGLSVGTRMKPSDIDWLGEIPAHWKAYRLATLYKEINEHGSDDLPFLRVSIHDGVSDRQLGDDELDRKVNRSEDASKYKRVAPGDLVYNMMRAWQGGFGTVMVPGQISPAYVVARPKSNFSSRFIELLLRTPQAIEEIRCRSYGVADFRLRLYWDNFKNIRVALPPELEQAEILAHIERLDQKFNDLIEKATISIERLQERRSALITAAVTGKIDVRSLAPTEAA